MVRKNRILNTLFSYPKKTELMMKFLVS